MGLTRVTTQYYIIIIIALGADRLGKVKTYIRSELIKIKMFLRTKAVPSNLRLRVTG